MHHRPDHDAAGEPAALDVRVDISAQYIGQVFVRGTLAGAEADRLLAAAAQVLAQAYALILDLRGLEGCDATGVEAVLEAHALAKADGRVLIVRPPAGQARSVFEDARALDELQLIGSPGPMTEAP